MMVMLVRRNRFWLLGSLSFWLKIRMLRFWLRIRMLKLI